MGGGGGGLGESPDFFLKMYPFSWQYFNTFAAECNECYRCNLILVSNQYPCSVPIMDSTNYQKYILNFLLSWLANRQWHFKQANHGTYSNPGTQVRAQNKDFSNVLQKDLTRGSTRGRSWPSPKGGPGHPDPGMGGGGLKQKKYFCPLGLCLV